MPSALQDQPNTHEPSGVLQGVGENSDSTGIIVIVFSHWPSIHLGKVINATGGEVRLRHFQFMRIEYPRARSHYLTVVGQFLMPSSDKATISFDSERRVLNSPPCDRRDLRLDQFKQSSNYKGFFNWYASATRSPNPMCLHVAVDSSRRPFRTLLQLSPRIFAGHQPRHVPQEGSLPANNRFCFSFSILQNRASAAEMSRSAQTIGSSQ